MEIAQRFAGHTPQSVRHIKRLYDRRSTCRSKQGCSSSAISSWIWRAAPEAIGRMSRYESMEITDPSRTLDIR